MSDSRESSQAPAKPLMERLSLWIGVLGSAITVMLTVWNAQTKAAIDRREESLKELEIQLKQRTAGIEESKERVERYKWVLTLLPSLTEADQSKKNFAVALVRLALTTQEAEQLFAGLQTSANQELRQAAREGFDSVQNQELNRLVLQINAPSAEERKKALAKITQNYAASPVAISAVLDLAATDQASTTSPAGVINGISFLSGTEPAAWTKENSDKAQALLSRMSKTGLGPQTATETQKLRQVLIKVPAK